MLDLKKIRSSVEEARRAVANRTGRYSTALEQLISTDASQRTILKEVEDLRARRNEASEKIGRSRVEKGTPEHARLIEDANRIKAEIQEKEAALAKADQEVRELLIGIPNFPHPSAPVGKTPEDNPVVREVLEFKREFPFKPKDHQDVGEKLDILDFKRAASLSGSRFALIKGAGARLERALGQFMLDLHTRRHGYVEIAPPLLVTPEVITGTGQLPKFEAEQYKTSSGEHYLIPTAEVPLTNLHRGEFLAPQSLPKKYAALTPCFRQEAGSYGKDTRGLIRNHQFDKVELVWICRPEDSMDALERLTRDAEEVLRQLKIPYRVIELCTGDMGFSACKSYDLEVWMPGENKFREISSCSNCWDFQARRMDTRIRLEKGSVYAHTLNGSGVAVGRAFAAVLENYQREDGSVEIPEVLRPAMGCEVIAAP
ncbi:MAG: serine--tRNA ligase [Elusimicrobia bacterium]|nr:serine--tRNA ligase [Elusimicrobiota bacterium]